MINNTALVLEGGGFRGIFTAGVLEVFLEKQLFFETVYGVSAGASYGASYLSYQLGRNIEVNSYIGDKRYCSRLHTRSVLVYLWPRDRGLGNFHCLLCNLCLDEQKLLEN